MKKINLLVIAPYKGMDQIIEELTSARDDVNVDCYVANLKDSSKVLAQVNPDNYDAIISRGGTASYIQDCVKLPVYDVGLSALDALRAIHLAQNFNQPMAIVGFENITRTARTLLDVLHYDIPLYEISNVDEVEAQLKKLQADGISVIVCDVISARMAPLLNITPVMVTNGYETVETALNQAISLTKRYKQRSEDMLHLKAAYDNSPVSCTIFDEQGQLVMTGLNSKEFSTVLPYLKEHLKELWTEDDDRLERPIKGNVLSITRKKVQSPEGLHLYLYTKTHEQSESRKIHAITERIATNMSQLDYSYFRSANNLSHTQDLIMQYSRGSQPIIISGERGTGKDSAAYYIYCNSSYKNSLFYQIDCDTATEKNWNFLLSHHDSPLAHTNRTIYFRHIDMLPDSAFTQLIAYIDDTDLTRRNRVFFSFVQHKGTPVNLVCLNTVIKHLTCLSLHLPPLRERTEDIPFLTTIFINQLNNSMGKQIIGFEPKASQALQQFPWENNLDQLRRIIRELMLVTNTAFITYENTMRILHQETSIWVSTDEHAQYQFDLSQTLDDINYDIIRKVLDEEGGSRQNAANRLGISRSTLWRILKMREGE